MNYIFTQINKKIDFLQSASNTQELKVHYQAKFELYLIYILAYLWNKNYQNIDMNAKEIVANNILKPSIGTIVSTIRILDVDSEFFGNKKIKTIIASIDKYPNFRNEKIGHGFSFGDDTNNYLSFFETFFESIESSNIHIIFNTCGIIKVTNEINGVYEGINYQDDGITYRVWSCPKNIEKFNLNDLYLYTENNDYLKISPFIKIESESEFYSFCSIEEKLTGRTKYNRLLQTATISSDVKEFEKLSVLENDIKKKSANGTVINTFENNFKRYIDIGIPTKIINFLKKNKASVFATIWGHGGVGKTASVQKVCDILCNQDRKLFDYILFLSAKDRYYNYYNGNINSIEDGISSLEDILLKINLTVFNIENTEMDSILNYEGKILLIIDDFETFKKEEREKIISFIKSLNINHHKVVITTRSSTLITGEEIETNELNEDETIDFLQSALTDEVPKFNIQTIKKELKQNNFKNKIFKITSGRPLFIFQLAILIVQKGTLTKALNTEINSEKNALDFLYDRIYDYLSKDAKNMFLAISLLTEENDLTALISNLKYILNKEDKDDEFEKSLNELIKLKIITADNQGFLKVYSKEIYKLMNLYYSNKGSDYDGNITKRFNQIQVGNKNSTDDALLENADSSRYKESEEIVENKYRHILNRDKASMGIRKIALLNLTAYLINKYSKVDKALKIFQDYFKYFKKEADFIEAYATSSWIGSINGSKEHAVKIINDFLASSSKTINKDTHLKLLGILMTYQSSLLIAETEDIKTQRRFNDITQKEYDIFYQKQLNNLKKIYMYPGMTLYNNTKRKNLMKLSGSTRNFVLDGLTHFVEIAIRNNKKDIGVLVCNKIIDEMPSNYQIPFQHKLNKINNKESEKVSNFPKKTRDINNKPIIIDSSYVKRRFNKTNKKV